VLDSGFQFLVIFFEENFLSFLTKKHIPNFSPETTVVQHIFVDQFKNYPVYQDWFENLTYIERKREPALERFMEV